MPKLTYGDVPLLFDFLQAAQDFLDRYQRIEDLVSIPEETSRNSWQTNPVGERQRVGLPRYNWPEPPPLRLNQIYWPTGATRWAYGIFLITTEQKEAIEALGCDDPQWLTSWTCDKPPMDGRDAIKDTIEFKAQMWALTPQRIAGVKGDKCQKGDDVVSPQDLYLLILVDDRYWWQFRDLGDIKSILETTNSANCLQECTTTWGELFSYIGDQLGLGEIDIEDIPAAYAGGPNCTEFRRQWDSAAMAFDAAAASVGARIVQHFDGITRLERPELAYARLTINLYSLKDQLAGDICTKIGRRELPENVTVTFPAVQCHHAECDGDCYNVTLPTAHACVIPGSVKTFHSTAWADYGCECEKPSIPDNAVDLALLAGQVKDDYVAWSKYDYDFTIADPRSTWIMTGYDDHALIQFGREWDCGIQAATAITETTSGTHAHTVVERLMWRDHQIRIQSLPLNVSVDSLLNDSDVTVFSDDVLVKLTSCWQGDDCCGNSATCGMWPKATGSVYRYCDCDWVDTGIEIPVFAEQVFPCNMEGTLKAAMADCECIPIDTGEGEYLWAKWNCDDERWHSHAKYDDLWRFELTESLCRGECAEAKLLLACCGSDVEETDITFQVCDSMEIICETRRYGGDAVSSSDNCKKNGLCGCVPAGTRGIARHFPDKCRFELVSLELCDVSQTMWVRAEDCILPGTSDGTAQPQKQDEDGNLVDDTDCEPVTIDNTLCQVMALPGEVFAVEAQECENEQDTYRPFGQFGLTRRVRIPDKIDCWKTGPATVLEPVVESSETTNCQWTETECEIEVCNSINRPVGCNTPEDGTAHLAPGSCMWYLSAADRPFSAWALLIEDMCPDDERIDVDSANFPTVCEWAEEIHTVRNPYDLAGCIGDRVELRWSAFDDTSILNTDCEWEVVQVQHHESEITTKISYQKTCTDSGGGQQLVGCSLKRQYWERAAVMRCPACVELEGSVIDFDVVTVVTGAGDAITSGSNCSSCNMGFKGKKVCVAPGCEDQDEEDIPGWDLVSDSVVLHLSDDGTCLTATVATIWAPCICDESEEQVICAEPCPTDSSS